MPALHAGKVCNYNAKGWCAKGWSLRASTGNVTRHENTNSKQVMACLTPNRLLRCVVGKIAFNIHNRGTSVAAATHQIAQAANQICIPAGCGTLRLHGANQR